LPEAHILAVANLFDSNEERVDRVQCIAGLLLKGIGEMRRAHERWLRVQLVREMMEHQHTLAGAVRSDFKAAAVTGKRIGARSPGGVFLRTRVGAVMLAIVKDHVKAPIRRERGAVTGIIGRAVAIVNTFGITVRCDLTVLLVQCRRDIRAIFGLVFIDDDTALIIILRIDTLNRKLLENQWEKV
jgi:hypothetical protein